MKTLKNNKLLAWMLAVITACCAFLGVILTTPQNVALADDSATQITNDTFPDTSTWEEKKFTATTNDVEFVESNVSGKYFRFYKTVDGVTYAFQMVINILDQPASVGVALEYETGVVTVNNTYGNIAYKEYDNYVDFIWYANENCVIEMVHSIGSEGPLPEAYMYELVEPEAQPGVDETPDAENDKPLSDKVADFINENTGLAVSGSLVTIVAIGAVVYFIFFRKRR